MRTDQPHLPGMSPHATSTRAVYDAFDPLRLTQARRLAGITKKDLSERIGVTAAAVGQYETGVSRPRPDLLPRLAEALAVPMPFFLAGRPSHRLDVSMAHFRSLRSTPKAQREKALALTEQVWELTYALERRIQLPAVDLPGFGIEETTGGIETPWDPVEAARALRRRWRLGDGPVTHLVRRMEAHGIVVVLPSEADETAKAVDAFSSRCSRPIAVLTPNRADDVYRHRFTAAHELGHLILHNEATGDSRQEREADAFAAEFLTPAASLAPLLPNRLDLARLADLRRVWGVSIQSLIYRCRELGIISDATASRGYQRLRTLTGQPGFSPEPVSGFSGEQPALLVQAYQLAEQEKGLSIRALAEELAWHPAHVRELLGVTDTRPVLRLV